MINLLPYDGNVHYFCNVVPTGTAIQLRNNLLRNIEWKHEEAIIYGRRIITKRKVAWYGDKPYCYTYSGSTKQALLWTEELALLKKIIEQQTGEIFNSCLLNLYHNGDEGMGWHSDNETSIQKNSAIASVSLGAERRFLFRHKKTMETVSLILENGSLLVMKGITQTCWHHSLPKSKKIKEPRINLTFRCMNN